LRHFDVQMIGGMVLHSGKIFRDEDRRGQDAGGHTACVPERAGRQRRARRDVNDYLAKRDAEWMGKI